MVGRLNFLKIPRLFFSTIMASVVGLEAVDKNSTHVSGNAAEFFDNSRLIFRP